MTTISKLALTVLAAFPLAACAMQTGVPEGEGPNAELSEGLCVKCVIHHDKIVHSEWSNYQIKVRDDYTATSTTLPVYGRHPVLSPDQSKVAYEGMDGNIYTASATDGSGVKKLTTAGGFVTPSWSPDGNTIVFASAGTAGWAADIYKVPAAGGATIKLTANAGSGVATWYFAPQYLNSTTIVFQIDLTGSASFGVVSANLTNQSNVQHLTGLPGGIGELSVSPSGTKVAFTKLSGSCGHQAIMVGTLVGTNVSSVKELYCYASGDSSDASIGGGSTLAFLRGPYSGTKTVMTIPLAGGSPTSQSITAPAYDIDFSMR